MRTCSIACGWEEQFGLLDEQEPALRGRVLVGTDVGEIADECHLDAALGAVPQGGEVADGIAALFAHLDGALAEEILDAGHGGIEMELDTGEEGAQGLGGVFGRILHGSDADGFPGKLLESFIDPVGVGLPGIIAVALRD